MKQRTIDTAREARLWIRDIIVPNERIGSYQKETADA